MSVADLFWYLDVEDQTKYKTIIFILVAICCLCAIFLNKKSDKTNKNLTKKKKQNRQIKQAK
jgi:ATP/ADP translocase